MLGVRAEIRLVSDKPGIGPPIEYKSRGREEKDSKNRRGNNNNNNKNGNGVWPDDQREQMPRLGGYRAKIAEPCLVDSGRDDQEPVGKMTLNIQRPGKDKKMLSVKNAKQHPGSPPRQLISEKLFPTRPR